MDNDFPEKGELVMGTVKSIFNQGGFIELDEYPGHKGMLHITEISLKWVRNIRDYIKEGQKVVLLVLKTDNAKGHIDLSLRRVQDSQRKRKLQDVKQKQRSDKLLGVLAKENKLELEDVISTVSEAFSEYESLYEGFEAISGDVSIADEIKIPAKMKKALVELIQKNINPPSVEVIGYVEFSSHKPDGVTAIKGALLEIKKHKPAKCDLEVSYVSAPIYRIKVKAQDYKTAEKTLKSVSDQGVTFINAKGGSGIFHRELESK